MLSILSIWNYFKNTHLTLFLGGLKDLTEPCCLFRHVPVDRVSGLYFAILQGCALRKFLPGDFKMVALVIFQ